MTDSTSTLLALVAHGSRDARWRAPFEALEAKLKPLVLPKKARVCYMEMASPTLKEVVSQAINESTLEKVVILPLLMAAGAHFANEIQEQTEELRQLYPKVKLELLSPVGEHPELQAALVSVALQALK